MVEVCLGAKYPIGRTTLRSHQGLAIASPIANGGNMKIVLGSVLSTVMLLMAATVLGPALTR
jgi:hypothetical protein